MPFEWLRTFQGSLEKPADYAAKTLSSYRLGMKAGGSIVGVVVLTGDDCCDAARELPHGTIYLPDEAPRLPLPGCSACDQCRCVYRPRMTYQEDPK